ncbi:MAG: hypothetical protein H0W50_11785 [Parachlamydiaceae bacterium]|nr:hypothetical protein [Parachlamydiaceae bacterium]
MNANSLTDLDKVTSNVNFDDDSSSSSTQINQSYQKSRAYAAAASIFFTGMIVGSLGSTISNALAGRITDSAYHIPFVFALISFCTAIPLALYSVGPCDRNRIDLMRWITTPQEYIL